MEPVGSGKRGRDRCTGDRGSRTFLSVVITEDSPPFLPSKEDRSFTCHNPSSGRPSSSDTKVICGVSFPEIPLFPLKRTSTTPEKLFVRDGEFINRSRTTVVYVGCRRRSTSELDTGD